MDIIKNLREILLLISMVLSFMGVYLVGVNKFFIERMKSCFKHYPGEDSKLNMFINMFTIILMIIDIISFFIIIILTVIIFLKGEYWDQIYSSLRLGTDNFLDAIYFLLTLFIFLGPLILLMFNLKYYEESKTFFKLKLGIFEISINSIKFKVICKIIGLKCLNSKSSIKNKLLNKKKNQQLKFIKRKGRMHTEKFIKKKRNFFKRSSIMYGIHGVFFIIILLGLYYITEDIFNDLYNICILIISSALLFMCITIMVFDISMALIYGGFMNNYTYVLVTKDNKKRIKCKAYLEYNDYYLVIQNSIEKYIKKSEIICIEKSKEPMIAR